MAGIMTPIGFLYFPSLFTAKANKQVPTQPPRYSGMLLFDEMGVSSAAYQNLRKGVHEVLVSKFGAQKAGDKGFLSQCRFPFRNASEKTYDGFEDGKIFISAWAPGDKVRPDVIDLQGNKVLDEALVFGGQLARFTVKPFAYDTSGNKGVGLILEHAQIVKFDMKRRDGGVSAEQAFANSDNSQLAALGIDPNDKTNTAMASAAGAVGQTSYQSGPPDAADLPF
jgi:hypothetical protein